MGEAKRRKLLDPNFGKTPKFMSGIWFSNDKKEEFTVCSLKLMSPDAFAEDWPKLTRQQEIQKILVKSRLVVITAAELRAFKFLVLTSIDRKGSVVSVLACYEKLGKAEKSQLEKIVVEINQYYAFEFKKAKGDANEFMAGIARIGLT